MPRFFFDLHNDIESPDDEGKVLRDLEAAQGRAADEAREMVCASVQDHRSVDLSHHIDIRDEAGVVVGVVKFEDAVRFVREGSPL